MRIRLRFFGAYRELAGLAETYIDVEEGLTLGELISLVEERYPRIGELIEEPIVSLNRRSLPSHTVLNDGDEVSLLPSVTGG